jgi:hypothetical protein
LDPARSFNISVTNTVSGGEMDIFSPAPLGQNLRWVEGYAFVGQFYEVTASESLEFSGPITIEITFGPDPLVGYPLLARTDPGEVLLARFANRQLEILDNLQVELQPDRYVVRGQYTPPSGGSGFDQLGTFVVLQTVPEPGSLMLLAMAGGWLFGRGRRQGWFAGRM